MTSDSSVLAVFAHPDDETLTAGGLLAVLARRCPVHLVTTNRGERGEVIPPDISHLEGRHAELAELRTDELSQAMAALGLSSQHFIDQLPGHDGPARYIDSGMRWAGTSNVRALADPDAGPDSFSRAGTEEVARVLAGHIRRLRPQLVLTDEPDGGYGHPDHVHCSRVVSRAVEIAAAQDGAAAAPENRRDVGRHAGEGAAGRVRAEATPEGDRDEAHTAEAHPADPLADTEPWHVPALAWVVRPAPVVRDATRWLREEPSRPRMTALGRSLQIGDPEGELPTIAVPAEDVDACIDTLEAAEAHLAAIRAYRSQAQDAALAPGSLAGQSTAASPNGAASQTSPAGAQPPWPEQPQASNHRPEQQPGHPVPMVRRPAEAIGWFALSNEILQPIYARVWLRAAPSWNTGDQLAEVLGRLLPPATTATAATTPATTESGAGASTSQQPLTGESAEPGKTAPAPRWYLMLMGAFTVVMGVIFAATGTAFHRWTPPWGIVIALVAVAAGGVLARTFADMRGALGYLLAVLITVFAATWWRPGGDVLVTNQVIGYVWLLGSLLAASVGALSPRRWFRDGS